VTDYPRTHWQSPSQPVTGPAKKAATTQAVAHWSGSSSIPTDKAAWLRAMQNDYVRNRGYSLGYWWLVCQNGDSYQIRGPELNSAANKGDKVAGNANDWTAPILFDVRLNESLTPAAIATARRLWNSVGVYTRPVPHHQLDATQCCGPHLTAQIAAGELDNPPPAALQPEPPPPPSLELPGDDDMEPCCYHTDTRINGIFANVAGRWIPWLHQIPTGARHYRGDHAWTREQILHDQGAAAAALWRARFK
jgi:hypothetical protein